MNSPKSNEKLPKNQSSNKRPSIPMSPSDSQEQIDGEESTPGDEQIINDICQCNLKCTVSTPKSPPDSNNNAQILDRVKSDRVTSSKPEEDRRRRTIIVEKRNGSYGFTLQSYGIHYKKEQEIEMITYVDYVEYDGPAYKAGMREGDVILSINGHDMEKADHKTLVNFIKNCDTRMRMVVLFEDCVRKVELHIRYIQLQRILQTKTAELDRLCLRERELLQGKWKTHSLPARKKGGNANSQTDGGSVSQDEMCCRPTVSTEDVAKVPNQSHQLLLAYQYLDPRYQYVLQSSKDSNEYLVTWNQDPNDSRQVLIKTSCDAQGNRRYPTKGYHQANGVAAADPNETNKSKGKSKHHHHHKHLCNPCIQANNNQDNNSLEAYDLASPCCDPHCVPSGKRRSRHQKHSRHDHQTKENHKENVPQGIFLKNQEYRRITTKPPTHSQHRSHKYFSFGSNIVSQCSLHSCTSSDVSNAGNAGESSAASYTTSLSTDTLYWDSNESNSRQHSTKSHQSSSSKTSGYKTQQSSDSYQYNPVKPKSWDNLTTKAFGGYGFGYGYLDTASSSKGQQNYATVQNNASNTMPSKANSRTHGTKINFKNLKTDGRIHSVQIYHSGPHHYVQPTKSSENLLLPKQNSTLSDSSLSCDCLDVSSPTNDNNAQRFFPSHSGDIIYYHRDKASQTEVKQRRSIGNSSGEVTRL